MLKEPTVTVKGRQRCRTLFMAGRGRAIVETTAGKVKWQRFGNGIFTFKGIPYAAPIGR
jgi:hypothetical protein